MIDLRESKSNMSALEFALLNDNMYFVKTLIGNGANMEGLEDIADKS